MNYCAGDVEATLEVFKVLWPEFCDRLDYMYFDVQSMDIIIRHFQNSRLQCIFMFTRKIILYLLANIYS